MRLRVGAGTDIGRTRELNEDAFALRSEDGLFVVCDGMGGAPAGEVASQMAVDAIMARLSRPAGDAAEANVEGESTYLPQTRRLADAVRRSDQVIYHQAHNDPRQAGMGTTVVSACIREHIASVAHVGDSRAYLWHEDRLEPLTRDHSLEEAQVSSGMASLRPEHRNVLVRVLGRGASRR